MRRSRFSGSSDSRSTGMRVTEPARPAYAGG